MSYGAIGHYIDNVPVKVIKKYAKKEYKAFEKALEDADMSLYDFALEINQDECSNEDVGDTYRKLTHAFYNATGIDLVLGYHPGSGNAYDEVDGEYWHASSGLYDYTDKVKELGIHKNIERRWFVTFG